MSTISTIAIMYDFDKTICTKDMQEYSFIPQVGIDPKGFWNISNDLAKKNRMDRILAYMFTMLDRAKNAKKPVLRKDFVKLGMDLKYFPGVLEWFERKNALATDLEINIEHYIISSGLKEIIEGSKIFKNFKEVFACEFYYDENGVACWPKNVVNYTTKTQFLFRINKGILDLSNDDDLNKFTLEENRPIPFRNMIYIGDGITDVPCMKLVKVNGGYSIAVYQIDQKPKVYDLIKDHRVDYIALADYSENSELDVLVRDMICKIAMVDKLKIKSKEQREEVLNAQSTNNFST